MHSLKTIRRVKEKDLPAMRVVLSSLVQDIAKPWFKHLNQNKCIAMAHKAGFIINETYLVIFSVEQPWFLDGLCLTEQFVGRLYPNKESFACVTDFLEAEALARGCNTIIAGSIFSYSGTGIAKLYERQGFRTEGVQLIKVIK